MRQNLLTQQQAPNLGDANMAHLMSLSQQGNPTLTHGALIEQATSQAAMQEMAQKENIEVPKVNFYPSRHPDPRKARKQDIKQAYRLLKPVKRPILSPRRWLFGGKHKHNKQTHICVIDGCDVRTLIQHDNLYMRITDEESGRSLWEMYWQNPVTGEPNAFNAREGVTSGRKMTGTYCPEHLHLYHLLCKWETEEEKEKLNNPKTIRERIKKGVSTVAVPVAVVKKKDNTPPMLQKYEGFFTELNKDSKKTAGIDVLHYQNPVTGLNDVTMIIFDLRIFQHELEQMEQQAQEAFQNVLLQQQQVQAQQTSVVAPQAELNQQQTNEAGIAAGV